MSGDQRTVLVVDDDPGCRDLHAVWLEGDYEVITAEVGSEALDHVHRADVALADREMPGMSGVDLARRVGERATECSVVVVSGVEPDVSVARAPIDEYLVKPVSRCEVRDVVDAMLSRTVCSEVLREFFSLSAKAATLERETRGASGPESEEYERLESELAAKRRAVSDMLEARDGEWHGALLPTVSRGEPSASN